MRMTHTNFRGERGSGLASSSERVVRGKERVRRSESFPLTSDDAPNPIDVTSLMRYFLGLKVSTFSLLSFLGALAVFFFGVRMTQSSLSLAGGDRLRAVLARATGNRFMGVGIGAIVALIFQSSAVTTLTLASLASAGLLTLESTMGIVLGADIGTTLVVILLSIRPLAEISLVLLIAGVALQYTALRNTSRQVASILLGFGFVFFGMRLIAAAAEPLVHAPLFMEILALLVGFPIYSLLAGAALAAVTQSSVAAIGVVISLAFAGAIDLRGALPVVLGANIGSCLLAVIASLKQPPAGKRVTLAQLSFKVAGVTVALICLDPLLTLIRIMAGWLPHLATNQAGMIALSHLLFNTLLAVIFIPFIHQGAWLLKKIISEDRRAKARFGPKYLDASSLATPALAFANVRREILRMMEIAEQMFYKTLEVFARNDQELAQEIATADDKIDMLDKSIKFYLAKTSQEMLTPRQAKMELALVTITAATEDIGDIINKNILELAEKKIRKQVDFSKDGWQELQTLHDGAAKLFGLTLQLLMSADEEIYRKICRGRDALVEMEKNFRQGHINRLHKGLKESFETSSIHLDMLSNIQRIVAVLHRIADAALDLG